MLFSVLRLISDLKLWNSCYVPFRVIVLFMLHNHLIIFLFRRYILSHRYIYEQIMYDRTSSYIDHSAPICATSSLLRLLRRNPEYLRDLCYSEIWDNAIVRGCNT